MELEPTYSQYDVDDPANVLDGTITTYGGFFNLFFDIPLGSSRFNIIFGGGAGWMWMDADIDDPSPGLLNRARGTDSGFAWQAIAGISAALSHNAEIQLDYRYSGLSNGTFSTDYVLLAPAKLQDIRTQVAMLSLRWYPGMARASAPPPPPPPPVRTFIVFFDFDKWDLTFEAQEVVSQAVRTAREVGVVRIVVTGHTDTAHAQPGTEEAYRYNQALSERRAQSVKDEMIRQGMNPAEIATVGRSFDDPLVPTGPGVREPQNRRAVIELR